MKEWTLDDMPDQAGRVAIVTGANTGIGFETAAALAAKSATVIMACRNRSKVEDAVVRIHQRTPKAQLDHIDLDLASLASVEWFAAEFRSRHDRLDLLINNAGVMVPPLGRTEDGFELQFGCNHLGHFALTGRLLDLLEATPAGRVVTISSLAHRHATIDFANLNAEKSYHRMAAYAQSKLANLLIAFELARRLEATGSSLISTAAHPGWTDTDLQRHSPFMRFFNRFFAQIPAMGALPTIRAATDPEANSADYFGPRRLFQMRGSPTKVGTSSAARDELDARRLWEVSEKLTGVSFLDRESSVP